MMWSNYNMGWGGWIVMTLAMVAFWALVVFAVVAIFRGTQNAGPTVRNPGRDPMEILDERFARGEIDSDDYHARKDVLRTVHSRRTIWPSKAAKKSPLD